MNVKLPRIISDYVNASNAHDVKSVLSCFSDEAEVVVTVEVSGTFDGSPVTLDYHFTIESDKILSLTID
jgi:hypothetical protein